MEADQPNIDPMSKLYHDNRSDPKQGNIDAPRNQLGAYNGFLQNFSYSCNGDIYHHRYRNGNREGSGCTETVPYRGE